MQSFLEKGSWNADRSVDN